jgi:hypothetical protein
MPSDIRANTSVNPYCSCESVHPLINNAGNTAGDHSSLPKCNLIPTLLDHSCTNRSRFDNRRWRHDIQINLNYITAKLSQSDIEGKYDKYDRIASSAKVLWGLVGVHPLRAFETTP